MINSLKRLKIEGCYKIKLQSYEDLRGFFYKNYNYKEFKKLSLNTKWSEDFFSYSKKNVIRGMHFQNPPFAQFKLIMCLKGSMLDIILDLRKSSKTYKKYISIKLSSKNQECIYIPPGIAHGFLSLDNNSIAYYKVSSNYSKVHDTGIKWNSFGFKWPINKPIVSKRDKKLASLDDFKNKFL